MEINHKNLSEIMNESHNKCFERFKQLLKNRITKSDGYTSKGEYIWMIYTTFLEQVPKILLTIIKRGNHNYDQIN